ncbi:MAG: hypothetical protein DCC67_09245 [Planctomycetota bacterium]|nr:MAG: hypothetical protein DCC67_09245 [Planctomycetota bacterium]
MAPVTVTCELCGERAFVHRVRYTYRADGEPGRPADEHVLVEIVRDVQCPNCGAHTQIEREVES